MVNLHAALHAKVFLDRWGTDRKNGSLRLAGTEEKRLESLIGKM